MTKQWSEVEARTLTRETFDKLTPRAQGYVSYMAAAFNPALPASCPYSKGSREQGEWSAGEAMAVADVYDCDDE